ncbi:MAG TPA: DNA methyltransferase [Roseiflexaceae bacterium]|nr:DNA methyltransferase [Roseiflexaceae bacterium]
MLVDEPFITQERPERASFRAAARTARRFFRQFVHERDAFVAALASVPEEQRGSIGAALLNRLIVLWFMQERGFLDNNSHYLPHALARSSGNFFQQILLPLLCGATAAQPLMRLLDEVLPPLNLTSVVIPDKAFERLFAFLGQYRWQLHEQSLQASNVLTPHILGYLLERQLDQKQHGAYYTDDDVSAYIAANTLIPWLLDAVRACCASFDDSAWPLLAADPDRYIFPAMRHGADLPLPPHVAAGCADVAARSAWNQAAPPTYALPNETWRDVVARRERYAAMRALLISGAVRDVNTCITLNLDLQQFAHDMIMRAPDGVAQAWWQALTSARALDPTCGSGAFLLAAMHVLQPLHRAGLERLDMNTARFPNRDAFITHSIIVNNLHGVDVMPEAVAMCELRLLLQLIAQIPHADDLAALPAPVLHIHCGNVLSQKLFHHRDTESTENNKDRFHGHSNFDIIIGNPPYISCKSGQQALAHGYQTERCGNLYALVVERSLTLLRAGGRLGMIVPIASVSTGAMEPLQKLYQRHTHWHSHFAVRPGKLFDGVDMNLTITLLHKADAPVRSFSTGYRRWSNREPSDRPCLFSTLVYAERPQHVYSANPFPKHGSALEWQIFTRMAGHGRTLRDYVAADGTPLFYHSGGRYWRKALFVKRSSHYKPIAVMPAVAPMVFALLNSQLFYWYWICQSNCMDVVAREVLNLPVFALETVEREPFMEAMQRVLAAYNTHSTQRARRGTMINGDEINVNMRRAKPTIDVLDDLLARGYGFSAEEADFIRNYDIKYRVSEDER